LIITETLELGTGEGSYAQYKELVLSTSQWGCCVRQGRLSSTI